MRATSDLKQDYDKQGYVILRGLYTKREMDAWKAEANSAREQAEGNFGVHVWMLETMPSFFQEAFCAATLTDPIKAIYEADIELLSAKPVFKSGKVRDPSPWHQDYAYWRGNHKLSVWVAMDPATPENGCLRVVPGGHRAFIEHIQERDVGFVNRLTEEMLPDGEIVDCVMEPGDAIFFHDLLPHASYPNTSDYERWSMIPTYRSVDPLDSSRTWSSSIRL